MTDFKILPLASPSFERELVNVEEIKRLCALGLDDCPPEDRAIAWLVLLGIYPNDPLQWQKVRNELKSSYWSFVSDNGLENWHNLNLKNNMQLNDYDVKEKPLMSLIHGDIVRTGRTIFFLPPDPIPSETPPEPTEEMIFQFGRHARRLERMLYIFGVLNVGLGYMQGFNELIIPFYYVFIKALPFFNNDIELLEALTFQALQALLNETELNELYTTNDQSSIILHKLAEFEKLMAKHLPDIAKILNTLKIHPVTYCFRWFNLIFLQEHDLPNIITIWDDILAHFNEMIEFEFYIGLGHLNEIKGVLNINAYEISLSALQNFPDNMNLKNVIQFANKCWDMDHKTSIFSTVMNFLSKKI